MPKFFIAVLDTSTTSSTAAERAAVDVFNDMLRANGHWVMATGLAAPADATVVDGRGERPMFTGGSFLKSDEYMGGFWIIDAPDRQTALRLAAEASKACNRRNEVRQFLDD